jgi:ribose transport system substrate-binding protein
VRIAIIPQTTGTPLWGPMFDGAQSIASNNHVRIYWNAPTSEDNIKTQIALIERVIHSRKYSGIILAPDHDLALMSAVQDAEAKRIPVVIVSSGLTLPPNNKLSYVLNNDAQGGEEAADYLGTLLHGLGAVAVIGIDPAILGNLQRERSFETTLRKDYPNISIVARRFGDYNVPHQTQIAASILKRFPSISAIVAVNPAAERGTWNTLLAENKTHRIKVIGFDQDIVVDGEGKIRINAIVSQNTYKMGQLAVQELLDKIHHKRVPPVTLVSPVLVTSSPTDSGEATNSHPGGSS